MFRVKKGGGLREDISNGRRKSERRRQLSHLNIGWVTH